MKRYYVLGPTLRDAVWCYNYMLNLLRNHIRRTDKRRWMIEIDEYCLIFNSSDLYWRYNRHGDRSEIISCYYVEQQVDRYRTLKGDLHD